MYRKLARVIGSVVAASFLALTLQACGGESPPAKPPEKKPAEEKKAPAEEKKAPAEEKKSGDAGAAKEVTYKCANAGCTMPTKTAAAGAPAPMC